MKPIPEMTTEEKNREVAEWLGMPFHKAIRANFTNDAGKEQLLRVMEKRDDWNDFKKLISCYVPMDIRNRMVDGSGMKWEYITDTTGKLLDAVLEWKRRTK